MIDDSQYSTATAGFFLSGFLKASPLPQPSHTPLLPAHLAKTGKRRRSIQSNSIRAHPKQCPLAQSHQLSLDSIRRLKSHPRSSQSVANPSLLRHADREQCKALESTASIRQLWQSRCDHREFREPPSAPVSLVTTPPGRQHNQTTTTANQRQMLRPDRWHCGRLLRHLGRTSRDLPDQKIAALKK